MKLCNELTLKFCHAGNLKTRHFNLNYQELSLQWNLWILTNFFLRGIHFRKHVKFSQRENKKSLAPKYFRTFNRKKVPLFEKSLMTLENWHQTKLPFKRMRSYSMFWSNHKKLFGKLVKRSLYLSPFWIS